MLETARLWLALAALNGLMGVLAGAFGAHGAHDPTIKDWLRTGAQYQLVHAVAGLACFSLLRVIVAPAAVAGWLFGIGALLFGGSLYLMALTGVKMLGIVTPIGGVLLALGWVALLWGALTTLVITA